MFVALGSLCSEFCIDLPLHSQFLQNAVRDMVQGAKDVSKVCRDKRKAECVKEGCQWNAGKCWDFSKWECSERKKGKHKALCLHAALQLMSGPTKLSAAISIATA